MPANGTRVYGYRWTVLAVFALINAVIQIQWLTFAPIAREARLFYGVSALAIDFLSLIFMGVFLVACLPASWVIDTWGNVACCGNAGGIGLNATNLPLILRGVSLIGISSNNTPYHIREILWERLANDWKPQHLDDIVNNEVDLEDIGDAFDILMKGGALGRTVVKLN